MKKDFLLLGRDLKNRVRHNTAQFVIVVLGLCVSAFTCMAAMHYFLSSIFEVNAQGEIIRPEKIEWASVAFAVMLVAVLFAFAFVNVFLLFRHLSRQQRKRRLIYKMYGCSAGELFFLSFAELMLYMVLGGAPAVGLYALAAGWMERMYCTMFPEAYWGIAIYGAFVLLLSIVISLTAGGVRLNRREG